MNHTVECDGGGVYGFEDGPRTLAGSLGARKGPRATGKIEEVLIAIWSGL